MWRLTGRCAVLVTCPHSCGGGAGFARRPARGTAPSDVHSGKRLDVLCAGSVEKRVRKRKFCVGRCSLLGFVESLHQHQPTRLCNHLNTRTRMTHGLYLSIPIFILTRRPCRAFVLRRKCALCGSWVWVVLRYCCLCAVGQQTATRAVSFASAHFFLKSSMDSSWNLNMCLRVRIRYNQMMSGGVPSKA